MESYVERPPLPGLAGVVRTVWIQRTGEAAYVHRHLPTGGVEIHFPIGGHPQLVGPLTGPEIEVIPPRTSWGVRRFAVASSLGVYIGRTETRWHEELPLPAAELPHLIIAFKKAAEPLTTHSLQGSGVQPVVLRIGSIWGSLMDPESPFNHIPPYISAVLRGAEPRPLHADDGGDSCYAPDAGRAIALLMTAQTLRHDTYNVSSGRPFTNRELADALQAITPGLRPGLRPGRQDGPGEDPYLDTTRLTRDTGFAPAFDVATAVADYVAWRAGHPR